MRSNSNWQALCMTAAVLLAASCAPAPPPAVAPVALPPSKLPTPIAPNLTVTISAAASTKEVVEAAAAQFQTDVGIAVQVNPGASSALANQILNGGPVDLFLSASLQWADEVAGKELVAKSARLLTNKLVIVVPQGNPGAVKSPQDLLGGSVKKIALAGEKVPAGMYADQALRKLDLAAKLSEANMLVRGQDVRAALAYVERGEAEAGIVYSTDVAAAKGIEQVYEFDPTTHEEIVYVLQLLKKGNDNPAAAKFFEFLQSEAADKIYAERGFSRLPATAVQP